MNRPAFAIVTFLLLAAPLARADEPAKTAAEAETPATREELEKKFAAEMSGATLVGHYSIGKTTYDKQERYELAEVTKIKGDIWLFKAHIVYGQHDVTVPLYLQVKWAGDTPVITLTDLDVPELGKYTARVLIHNGQYAGTWSGANHGGQLFGHVESKAAAGDANAKPAAKP